MHSIAAVALLLMGTSMAQAESGTDRFVLAQATPADSAHTLFRPNAPDPGRSGQVEQLPQGGLGVTTGGTAHYQTLSTPNGGSSVAVPNGNGTSNVIGSGGRSGTTSTVR
jgi:hypothetical protein